MKRVKLFIPLLVFLLLGVFLWRGLSLEPNAMPSALLGKPFPPFTLPRLEDNTQMLSREHILGKVALVNVWASWCAACKYEHPLFNALAEQGIPIIGINYKDSVDKARVWLQTLGNPYQLNILDQQGTLGIDLGVFGAPETYLIDAQGIIRYKHVGIVDAAVWHNTLQPLYAQYTASGLAN